MILAIFDLQVTPMLSSKFRVNWPFDSGKKVKHRFSRWHGRHGGHNELPIGTILDIFYLQVALMLPTKFRVNWLSVQEKKRKIDFQDGMAAVAAIWDFRSERF